MKNELTHILMRLDVEGQKTTVFFAALTPAEWEQAVYTTGSRWRVKQVLAHFISAERAYQYYIKNVLAGGSGAPSDLDINAFNDSEAPAISVAPVDELIASFSRARQETMELTVSMTELDLRRTSIHPWFGEKELSWFLKLLYRHNQMHLQDVRKVLETGRPLTHLEANSN